MAPKLVAEEGVLKGLVLNLEDQDQWVLGRDPELSQLVLEDPSVSRKHLSIRQIDDKFNIANLSETNPVLVNQQEISEEHPLKHGDLLRIGEGVYRFYAESEPEVEDLNQHDTEEKEDLSDKEVETETETKEEEKIDTLFEEGEKDEVLAEVDLDLSDTNPWMLKVVSGPNNGAQFSMEKGTSYTIGKDPSSCDIVFNDVSVSREHARLTINSENQVFIEDMDSRNGTLIENKPCEGKQQVQPNSLISTGTTSFVIFDQESERETVISPLLPAIVKILQEDQKKPEEEKEEKGEEEELVSEKEGTVKVEEKSEGFVSTRILVGILIGLFLVVGFGTISLFTPQRIATKEYNTSQDLGKILGSYPSIQYSFNPTSGRLLLLGHVLTEVDRNQLIYNLKALPFVSTIDNNIIVDENIWQETNQVLAKNPNWRGVSIHSPSPGQFILTGYLQTRKQADSLNDYLSQNFPYLELLTQKVIVEENILNQVLVMLKEEGFNAVEPKVTNGEVILSGDIPFGERPIMDDIIAKVKKIQGVRDVKPFITELPPADTLVNITNQYNITGSLEQGDGKISVVINGQLLTEGDSLDGRLITKIDNNMILLEKGGVKYRIDYNR